MVSLGSAALIQAASTIQLSAASYSVAENVGANLTVQRTGDTHGSGPDYANADGTAQWMKYTASGR
jgi:hypothetical protein